MDPLPLPPFEWLDNRDAWIAVFGSVNLYDAELRAIQIDLQNTDVDLNFYLPGEFAAAVPLDRRTEEYCITIRCVGATDLRADNFDRQNVVGDYAFEADASSDTRIFRMRGVFGSKVLVRCHRILVAQVASVPPAA